MKIKILLFICIFFGGCIRLYNLNWGAPFFFNPDERNIASSISQLTFPTQMNPHFFAYGSLPLYIIYFTGVLIHFLSNIHSNQNFIVSFSEAILISRLYSAFLSILLIPLIFFIGKKMYDTKTGIYAAFFTTSSVGFLQFAHFGTFEIWITFFSLLFFLITLSLFSRDEKKHYIFAGFLLGILLAIKVSSLIFFIVPFLWFLFYLKKKTTITKKLQTLLKIIGVYFFAFGTFLLTTPFFILDFSSFMGSISYESHVALGTQQVFYTQGFIGSIPIFYQFRNVYPFLISPLIEILFLFSFLFCWYQFIKKRQIHLLLLLFFFSLNFFSQAFFFVKWTRYMIPTLPYIFLLVAWMVGHLMNHQPKPLRLLVTIILVSNGILYALLYFSLVLLSPDSRVTAAAWATKHMHMRTPILSESYDLGIVPFNSSFSHITLFNFYDLDTVHNTEDLKKITKNSQYIILPSQRVLHSRLSHPTYFVKSSPIYISLFKHGQFKEIYQTSCSIFCHILYTGNPITSVEETAAVFDRPTIFIFQKK